MAGSAVWVPHVMFAPTASRDTRRTGFIATLQRLDRRRKHQLCGFQRKLGFHATAPQKQRGCFLPQQHARSHQWISTKTGSTQALYEGQDGLEAVDSTSEGEVTQSQYRWRVQFEALVEFKEKHGHCNVPRQYKENPQLGRWVNNQRWAECNGKLVPERKRQLDELGFVWSKSSDEAWEEMFRQLEEFQMEQGHCNVPQQYENPKLGWWVNTQRTAKAEGQLVPERKRRLEELGFVWSKSCVDAWEEMFRQLEEFKEAHGHCNVPSRYEKNPKLGVWVNTQRQAKAEGKMAPERERRLEDLGFVWRIQDEAWQEMFRQLEEFKKAHGHCNVPLHYEENPQLGVWVNTQRTAKAEGKLAPERERRLEDLGFVWRIQDEAWEEMFRQVEEFKEAHGHCNVPPHYEENPKLGVWVNTQRKSAKAEGQLVPERKRRLDELGFVWSLQNFRWEEMFRQLEEFKKEHGHCRVPWRYKKNPKLGRWVKTQRQAKAKKRLAPEREQRLKELGVVWI